MKHPLFFLFCFLTLSLFSDSKKEKPTANPPVETSVISTNSAMIGGVKLDYKTIAGTLILKDDQEVNPTASIFYIAYFKENPDKKKRPITFCFNGGPGCPSLWLHLGLLGPKRVNLPENGPATPPFSLVNNDSSLLDLTDLVFIDPVSTGYSRAAPGEDPKQFFGVTEDVKAIGEFIRIFTTRYALWDAPKFLAGESYGSARAAELTRYLQTDLNMFLNGVILISSVLNFQTLDDAQGGNDLPYPLALPSYTAAAWEHKKLPPKLQEKNLKDVLAEVEKFSLNEYTLSLAKGDTISEKEKSEIVQKLVQYTGLTETFIRQNNMRMNLFDFARNLFYPKNRIVGIYDSRIVGISYGSPAPYAQDPTFYDSTIAALVATFNQYVQSDLNYKNDLAYIAIADVDPWKYPTNAYLDLSSTMRNNLTQNPSLRLFIASGYNDLVTPYFATTYTFNHLGLDPSLRSHITSNRYVGGHMMYFHIPSLVQMKKDLTQFFKETLL
jgi:carboxypeptidase C (cathepsin A)